MNDIKFLNLDLLSPVVELQKSAYPDFLQEEKITFLNKIELFPEGCFGIYSAEKLLGYTLSHPWNSKLKVDLNTDIKKLPKTIDCYYIHDFVVNPSSRGKGISSLLFNQILKIANKYKLTELKLVAVQNAHVFWESLGFKKENEAIKGYGELSCNMRKKL